MFSGTENSRSTANVNVNVNLFAQIFERKIRIVEQVKQQVDLYDQHLASKCLLAGLSPPSWLWSPSIPEQTSELNKEEIISGLLFPQSRPSIICPTSRPFSYQQPVSFLAKQDQTSVVNIPLEEQLLEEEQHNLSHSLIGRVSNHSHEQDANIASPRDVHEEERVPESVLIFCKENQSRLSPEYSQNQRVGNSLDATSPGCSQGKKVPKSLTTPDCERKPSSPGYCQDETEPSTCFDGLPLAKIQRSKSRQKDLELRSSAKNSRSNSRNMLNPSLGVNIGLGFPSLMSDSVSEIKLFKHDENDGGCRDRVENSNSQGKGSDQCIKVSSTRESSIPQQKVDSMQKSCGGEAYASIVPESTLDSCHVNEMDILQCIETIDEVSGKVAEQVDDPQSRSCNETAYFDGGKSGTNSKSSSQDNSERKHQKSSNSFSGDFQSEIITRSRSNARENRSKTKHSGSVESSSIEIEPKISVSLLQDDNVKETLNPSTDGFERLVAENITSDDQSKDKGECVDTNRCSSAGRVSQTGISTDETTFSGTIQKSSVELKSGHSVVQSDDESVLLKPVTVTGEVLLGEKDNNGESIELSSILKSRRLSQTDIDVVESVVEFTLQESSTPDISFGSKEVQPQGSLTKGGSNQSHGRISRPRSSAIEDESANECKVFSAGSNKKSADKQLEVGTGSPSLRSHDLSVFAKLEPPHCDNTEEHNFDEIPRNSRGKCTLEKAATPASAARVFIPSLTDSEVNCTTDNEMNDIEGHNGLKIVTVLEMESHTSNTGLKMRENEPPESNTFTGHIIALTERPQHETTSVKGVSPISGNIACTEIDESHGPESSMREFVFSSSSMGGTQLPNKRRKTLDKQTSRVPSSSPGGDILDSDSGMKTVHHTEETACHNLYHYDDELQKMIGSISTDHYAVELQKMMGSASSADLKFDECCLFKKAGLMSPASFSLIPEQLCVQKSQIAPDFSTFGLIGSDDGSPPVLEGFIIQTDDENQSGSKNQINHNSLQLPRTSAESVALLEQICKSAYMTTPSSHLAKTFKFAGKLDLDQSVSTELLDGMYFNQNLDGSFAFDNLGINHDYTGRSYTECLPFSGAGSSADARNLCTSPAEKLWYRSLQKSSSSEKRASQTPDLPSISEENEDVDEEAENLCATTPKSTRSEKRGSSIPDLRIAEENENMDEISNAVDEASDTKRENVSAERKPLGDVNEDTTEFLPSVSKAKIPIDRTSLDSVNTAFSFTSKCNNSVKSKVGRQNGGSRRFTGKENQGGGGVGRNVKPPSSRFSKAKLPRNSSLTTVGPRLPEKEPRHNNIVSNITSFVPLVQQQKPESALITGKRDVKVKALEAAEASKRIAEQKENDRKMKKEAMKLERARKEQENLIKQEMEKKQKEEDRKKKEAEMARKQEMEKKKKEEDRKKKEAEMALKQEMEKKKKEEERKRKEFEMADRKRQREEESKKLKEAKRQRIAENQKQQREVDQKLQAEKELKRQAMVRAQQELKEDQSNAEKTRGQANTRIPEVRSKSNSSDDTNTSRNCTDGDSKVISNPGKMSEESYNGIEKMEESYDISPYKCSDDEDEDEDDDDISNHKFVPTWASKDNILLTVISQQNCHPEITFPTKSFCSISKILLPRKFKSK